MRDTASRAATQGNKAANEAAQRALADAKQKASDAAAAAKQKADQAAAVIRQTAQEADAAAKAKVTDTAAVTKKLAADTANRAASQMSLAEAQALQQIAIFVSGMSRELDSLSATAAAQEGKASRAALDEIARLRASLDTIALRMKDPPDPSTAVVDSIISIYNTLMFFTERMMQIAKVVNSFVTGISDIGAEHIDADVAFVERVLSRTLPLVVGFADSMLGLGGVSDRSVSLIESLRVAVDTAIAKVIGWAISRTKSIASGGDNSPSSRNEKSESEAQTQGEASLHVWDGAVEVAGRGRVERGETLRTVQNRPASPGGTGVMLVKSGPRPDTVRIDPGLFSDTTPLPQKGLYVWVREGSIRIEREQQSIDVNKGNAIVFTDDKVTRLDAVPGFMQFDKTPLPAKSYSGTVLPVFRLPDGSIGDSCTPN